MRRVPMIILDDLNLNGQRVGGIWELLEKTNTMQPLISGRRMTGLVSLALIFH
jgi:hypothetical protein